MAIQHTLAGAADQHIGAYVSRISRDPWPSVQKAYPVVAPVVIRSAVEAPLYWRYVAMRLVFTGALFTILVQWEGLPLDEHGRAHRHIAPFSL